MNKKEKKQGGGDWKDEWKNEILKVWEREITLPWRKIQFSTLWKYVWNVLLVVRIKSLIAASGMNLWKKKKVNLRMLPGINLERRNTAISEKKYITDGNCQSSMHVRVFWKSPLNDYDTVQSTLNKLDQSPRGKPGTHHKICTALVMIKVRWSSYCERNIGEENEIAYCPENWLQNLENSDSKRNCNQLTKEKLGRRTIDQHLVLIWCWLCGKFQFITREVDRVY